jgi:hypothetical protein
MRADLQNAKKTSESGNITKPGYSVTHGIQVVISRKPNAITTTTTTTLKDAEIEEMELNN